MKQGKREEILDGANERTAKAFSLLILAFIDSSTRDQSRKKRASQADDHDGSHVNVKVTHSFSDLRIQR